MVLNQIRNPNAQIALRSIAVCSQRHTSHFAH